MLATPDVAARLTQSLIFSLIGDEGHRAHTAMYARQEAVAPIAPDAATSQDAALADDAAAAPDAAACPTSQDGAVFMSDAASSDAAPADAGTPNPTLSTGPSVAGPPAPFDAWPHAQDLYHQQMYVEMLRRAFEGGLRLMFASVQDNQSLATVIGISVAPGPLRLDPARDIVSAERQLEFIERMVSENSDFLRIVTTPRQARDAIDEGRLAIVMSLEIDWLPLDVVRRLHDEHSVRHIVPIHLADNEVGGTAAYTPVFNMHNALFQRAMGAPSLEYFELEHDDCIVRPPGAPLQPSLQVGLLFLPEDMSAAEYFALGYESCDVCALGSGRSISRDGIRNAIGIRNMSHIRALMRMGMLVDVVHMSLASARDTIGEAERWGYPVLDTHTGVSHTGRRVGQDRELPLSFARRIYRNQHGVIGLGTGPQGRVVRELYSAAGAPLIALAPEPNQQLPPPQVPSDSCTPDDLAAVPSGAEICVATTMCGGAQLGVVEVRTCDGNARAFDLVNGCTGPLSSLGDAAIESVIYHGRRPDWCDDTIPMGCSASLPTTFVDADTDDATALVAGANLQVGSVVLCEFDLPELPLGAAVRPDTTLGSGSCAPRAPGATCFGDEGTPGPTTETPAAVVPGSHVLRVRARPSGTFSNRVRGSSAFYSGSDVVLHVSFAAGPTLDITLNHRGLWVNDTQYDEYRIVGHEPTVTAVSISVNGDDPRPHGWALASLLIEEVEDPILAWTQSYAQLQEEIARAGPGVDRSEPVVFAIGTDMNGFAPQFPVSAVAPDVDGCQPFEVCSTETGACTPLRMADRGVANYAMLGDFFAALGSADVLLGHDDQHRVQDAVFSSADALLRTWEAAEERAASVPQ